MIINDIKPENCVPEKIGVSFSGGSERGIIHLGIVKAFIELGIKPAAIAGVSAGSFAAAIFAYNPDNLDTVKLAVEIIKKVKPKDFGLSGWQIFFRIISQGFALQSLGDFKNFRKLIEENLPFKTFEEAKIPFFVCATNRLNGQENWFASGSVVDAITASTALPVAFPPVKQGGEVFVDGGLTDSLPLFRLAQKGCGTIFAINLGYAGETRKPPRNLLDNLFGSIDIALYQSARYEVALIKALYPKLNVIEIHPQVAFDLPSFNFTPDEIEPIVEASYNFALPIIKNCLK